MLFFFFLMGFFSFFKLYGGKGELKFLSPGIRFLIKGSRTIKSLIADFTAILLNEFQSIVITSSDRELFYCNEESDFV